MQRLTERATLIAFYRNCLTASTTEMHERATITLLCLALVLIRIMFSLASSISTYIRKWMQVSQVLSRRLTSGGGVIWVVILGSF